MQRLCDKNYFITIFELYKDSCERSKFVASFTDAAFKTRIFITDFDISTNVFNGLSGDPWGLHEIATGTIEENCTGLISGNTFGNNVFFTFDSDNLQLDMDGFGTFSFERAFS